MGKSKLGSTEGPQWTSHECVCIEASQRLRLVGITTNPDGSWWLKEIPSNFSAANEKTKAQNYRNGRESNRWSTWQRPKKKWRCLVSPKDSPKSQNEKKKKAFHGLRRGLSGSSPSNLLKALTGATSMNLLLAIPGYLHPGRGLKHWIFGSHWSEFSCLVFTGSMSGVFPQKKKTLQKTQRAKTFSAVGLFHSQETATRVSHGRSESLRQAWSWSSDMLVRNSSKTWLHGAFSDSRGVASSSVSDLGIHWLKPFFLLKLQCFPSQMFKSGKAKIWFFGERSDWTDALETGSNQCGGWS